MVSCSLQCYMQWFSCTTQQATQSKCGCTNEQCCCTWTALNPRGHVPFAQGSCQISVKIIWVEKWNKTQKWCNSMTTWKTFQVSTLKCWVRRLSIGENFMGSQNCRKLGTSVKGSLWTLKLLLDLRWSLFCFFPSCIFYKYYVLASGSIFLVAHFVLHITLLTLFLQTSTKEHATKQQPCRQQHTIHAYHQMRG